MTLLRPLLRLASPAGPRGRLLVLVLHRVLPAPDPMYPEALDAGRFTEMCRWVDSMFNVLPLEGATQQLRAGTLPERALAITFDDGYADNRYVALPILQRLGLPATVFVATGFLDGGCMWNDIVIESFRHARGPVADLRDLFPQPKAVHFDLTTPIKRRLALEEVIAALRYLDLTERLRAARGIAERLGVAVPTGLMMTSRDVIELYRGGLQVGAHTVSHPILAKLPLDQMRREMKDSKEFLERLTGESIRLFAYPNGKPGVDYSADTIALAEELGFDAALSTVRGAASRDTDPFQIPRFTPWDRSKGRFGARMLSTLLASTAVLPRKSTSPPTRRQHDRL